MKGLDAAQAAYDNRAEPEVTREMELGWCIEDAERAIGKAKIAILNGDFDAMADHIRSAIAELENML